MQIPPSYISQAVNPRGSTVNERLNFLLNWYETTGTKVAKDSTWDYQTQFNTIMAQFGISLRPLLMGDTDESTRNAINNFLPVVDYMRLNDRSAAGIAFFTYLSVELQKVVNGSTSAKI
jgi:hypothetical protein